MDAEGAGLDIFIAVVADEGLDVAVEDDADELAGAVDHGAAGVAADDVGRAHEVKRHGEIEGGFLLDPARREIEGRLVVLLGGAGVEAGEIRRGGNLLAVLDVAFHRAVAEAEGEGGIGVVVGAVDGEAGFADEGLGLLLDLGLGLDGLAEGAGLGVDRAGDFDHRVLGGGDGGGSALVEFLAEGDVADLRGVDQLGGADAGGLAREDGDDGGIVDAEIGGERGQGVGEREDFEVGVDGFVGEELLLEGLAAGVGVFGQAFAVGLGALVAGAEEAAGEAEGIGVEAVEGAGALDDAGDDFLGGGDAVVGGEGLGAAGGVGEFLFQRALGGDLTAEENGILEGGDAAVGDLARVLDAEEFVFGAAGVFGAAAAPGVEENLFAFQQAELVGDLVVADVFEFGDREQPTRGTGMAGDESEFTVGGAVGGPLEEVGRLDGPVVFVDAEKCHIEAVAGVFEIIGIAAVERDLLFGGEDEADVGVAFEAVEVVGAALVEGDDIAAEAGFLAGFLFDLGDDFAAGEGGVGTGEGRGDGGVDAGGDVFDGLEDVYLEVVGLDLIGLRLRVETVAEEVSFLRAHLLERVGGDVVVGEDEAVAGDERGGTAAVEADGREADMVEPGIGEIETVFGHDLGAGRSGEEPHAFVGAQGAAGEERGEGEEDGTEFHRGKAKAGGAAGGEQEEGGGKRSGQEGGKREKSGRKYSLRVGESHPRSGV